MDLRLEPIRRIIKVETTWGPSYHRRVVQYRYRIGDRDVGAFGGPSEPLPPPDTFARRCAYAWQQWGFVALSILSTVAPVALWLLMRR